MDFFLASNPAPAVAALYGPVLTARVSMAQAHWLLQLGRLPDFWKQTKPYTAAGADVPAAVDAASAKGKPAAAAAAPAAKEKACLDKAAALLQVSLTLLKLSCSALAPHAFGKPYGMVALACSKTPSAAHSKTSQAREICDACIAAS